MYTFDEVWSGDYDVAKAIEAEIERQNNHIELIASENFVSKAVFRNGSSFPGRSTP